MKFGMNLLLWTTHVTESHFPRFASLKQAGFDGIEIPIFEGDAAHYRRVGRAVADEGLACTAVTIVNEQANPISPDPAVRQAAVERLRWAIDMASLLRAPLLGGPFHSPLAVFSGAGPTSDERLRAADVLRAAAEHAGASGVVMAIEYLNRFECYFLTTAAQAHALVQAVDHPAFRMMYDTFHAHIEEKDVGATIASIADSLVHVHVSENDRGTPGTGQVRWDDTFRALQRAKYDRWLVVEAFGRALPALAAATRIWRDLFASDEEVPTRGLAFIRKHWASATA